MGGRILVVDDEAGVAGWISSVLSDLGFHPTTATRPEDALSALQDGGGPPAFDLVLSDIQMPGLSGIELLERVRLIDVDLPVILITGEPTLETAIRAVEIGAVQYLVKPVSPQALAAAAHRGLHLRKIALLRRERSGRFPLPAPPPGLEAVSRGFEAAMAGLWPAFQPIVHAGSGDPFGYEVLLRTDEGQYRSPEELLGAGERLGRAREIGRGLRKSVAAALENGEVDGSVFVNLHVEDLSDTDLVSETSPLTRQSHRVVLEVTERASFGDVPDIRERIHRLRSLGYRIAVDDLGAGFSGLSTFVLLQPDLIKFDATLVRGAHRDPTRRKLIGSLAGLCRDLGIESVAEGIESGEDRATAAALGCDYLQGYAIGLPRRLPSSGPPFFGGDRP